MATSIISAGDAANLGIQTTGGDDGVLVLRSGTAGSKVDALNISASGTGAFVGEVTATGFTGTLDGILGSGAAAAATVTTLTGTTITAQTAFVPDASDGAALGTAALEFSDLFLADGGVINLGDDQDVTITHVADTGIALNSKDIAGVASINSGQLAGNRNIIINGDFTIWQRGTSQSALSAAGTYLADRWTHQQFQTALHSRQAFAASGTHPGNSQYVLRASGDSTTTVSRIQTAQGVESINCIPLRGKTITMSMYVRCAAATMPTSSLGNFSIVVGSTSATADSSISTTDYTASGNTTTTIAQGSLPTTWTKITNTYTVPTDTNNIAAYVGFSSEVDAGTGDWYEISQVQVEIGSTATPFEQRLHGTELALCQRYTWKYGGNIGDEYLVGVGFYSDGNQIIFGYIQHPVRMRATPTLTVVGSPIVKINGGPTTGFTPVISTPSALGAMINMQKTSHGLTANVQTSLNCGATSDHFFFVAEL